MDEKRKNSLLKFFSVSVICFGIIYFAFMLLAVFSSRMPIQLVVFLGFASFILFIMNDTVDEKADEVGNSREWRILSFVSFTILILLCYAVIIYIMQLRRQDSILWAIIALYDSTLLDKSIRALVQLKRT